MSKTEKQAPPTPAERHEQIRTEGGRETVESIVVAIILALLFRAFVAEAFVIPTGSMAPTLMGAHKDVTCLQCGQPYQAGASIEARHVPQRTAVVASVCPNCRYENPIDLAGRPNDATFAGDRILVSKFAYALGDPNRWDVIVFKYPGNPKQNYIKRLVGLPEETLRIRFGDVYARPFGQNDFEILRKPPSKAVAMAHQVHDTHHQPELLVQAGYPSRWQPWHSGATVPPTDSWTVERDAGSWSATLAGPSDQMRMLRYYHRWADSTLWDEAASGASLADVDPYSSYAITDFYAYDAYVSVAADEIYETPPGTPQPGFFGSLRSSSGVLRADYQPGLEFLPPDRRHAMVDPSRVGKHWVGDLMVEADLETQGSGGEAMLELVEAGILYRCYIDLNTGVARLEIHTDAGPVAFADAGGTATATPTAQTEVRAGGRHSIRFANFDDQLYLWVDGDVVTFDAPTTFATSALLTAAQQRPRTSTAHPLDAAPVAIGVQGADATVHRLQVFRDKYYIAVDGDSAGGGLVDYDLGQLRLNNGTDLINELVQPHLWDQTDLWQARRTVQFNLEEDQFFPLGDNSPESQDARCWIAGGVNLHGRSHAPPEAYIWAEASYVPRDLLVGKALMVFWPHTWNTPVPFTPNFPRIGLIR